MNACYYSIILFCLSVVYSTTVDNDNNNHNKIESSSSKDEQSEINDDPYIDESKYHRASHEYEQELLANIYAPHRNYISVHDDRVYPSNFTYFTFNNLGTYRFILISLRGDADLYVSTRYKHVTYDNYEYSSCTCGIDEIYIDPYVKRPIYIGIYGYSQYRISHYRLLIELIDSTIPIDETYVEESNDDKSSLNKNKKTSRTNQKHSSQVIVEGEKNREHLLWNIFVWILNLLVEILT